MSGKMVQLTLYYIPNCPHCQKVFNFMKQNGISVHIKNRDTSPEIRSELIQAGGQPQVPCLVVDGKALYESDDIIEWLRTNYKR